LVPPGTDAGREGMTFCVVASSPLYDQIAEHEIANV
jgi:hypothetical protein